MGWQETLANSSPFMAEKAGYEAEIQNQLRQAQAAQLVQEALKSQTMLPYEVMSKIASSNQMNAQAEAMRREKVADPRKAAEAQRIQMELLHPALGSIIEPIKSARTAGGGRFDPSLWEDRASKLDPIIKGLEEAGLGHIGEMLKEKDFASTEAFYNRMGRDKQTAATDTANIKSNSAATVAGINAGASNYRADKSFEGKVAAARIAATNASSKPSKESYQNAAVSYQRLADAEKDPTKKKEYEKIAKDYEDKALKQARASAAEATERERKKWETVFGSSRSNKQDEPKNLTTDQKRDQL